jgi:hypothetical protein
MICYRDKVWCPYWQSCAKGGTCDRAWTKEVQADAVAWWGGVDAPVQYYSDKPECFSYKGES